jgi:ABC-2 type transport system ATP-binding protein
MDVISIRGLRKTYRTRKAKGKPEVVEAVRGIDLSVRQGEVFGFLGPNGAGKTTTLRILATLLPADAGTVSVGGHDPSREADKVRRSIGYVSQAGGTDKVLTGRENIILQGRLQGLSAAGGKRKAEDLIRALDLSEYADRMASTYSGGQRRKLDIALGMVNDPAVLFLDEPTTGLDPVSRAQLWERIRGLRGAGTTVFLTTHYMEEADALCGRIAIVDHGRIVAQGTPADLKAAIEGDILTLKVNRLPDAPRAAAEALRSLDRVREIDLRDGSLRLVVANGGETLQAVLKTLEGAGVGVSDIAMSRPSLDDVFLRATGHTLAGDGNGKERQ